MPHPRLLAAEALLAGCCRRWVLWLCNLANHFVELGIALMQAVHKLVELRQHLSPRILYISEKSNL